MLKVSTNISKNAAINNYLRKNMDESSVAAQSMATGEAITRVSQDPTGFVIGNSMRAESNVTNIVLTGLKQSVSMLTMRQDALMQVKTKIDQMEQTLAKANGALMTDELCRNTLKPYYVQLQDEINRIADTVKFNGQRLMDASMGEVNKGEKATLNKVDDVLTFKDFKGYLNGIGKGTPVMIDGKEITLNFDLNNASSVQINGGNSGTLKKAGANYRADGITLKVMGVTASDTNNAGDSYRFDMEIKNISIEVDKESYDLDNGIIKAINKCGVFKNNKIENTNMGDCTFSNVTKNGSVFNGLTAKAGAPVTLSIAGSPEGTKKSEGTSEGDVMARFQVASSTSGGTPAHSRITLTAGSNLAEDRVSFDFMNIRLDDVPNGPTGLIHALNVKWDDNAPTAAPTALTKLDNLSDAERDIPIVRELNKIVTNEIAKGGAYEQRCNNMIEQLTTNLEQMRNAESAILATDLPDATENFATANVRVNISVHVMGRNLELKDNLFKIVQAS